MTSQSIVGTITITTLALAACIRQPEPRSKPAPAAAAAPAPSVAAGSDFKITGDATRGAAVYKQLCASCHGDAGRGDGAAAAALNPRPADFTDAKRAALSTDEQVYLTVKEGGPAVGKSPLMVAWKASLNEGQLQDVTAYVRSLSRAPAP